MLFVSVRPIGSGTMEIAIWLWILIAPVVAFAAMSNIGGKR